MTRVLMVTMAGLAATGCGPTASRREGRLSGPPNPRPATWGESPVLVEVPDDPTITFKVWFKVGSQDDPPGRRGLAYLTGQMLAAASTTRNSYEQILQRLYPLAASYSIRVDREMTVLTGRTHRDNLEAFYELFTDAYLRPAFALEDFERLRSNQLNYLTSTLRYASDEELAKAALYEFMFQGTGYAHPPEGAVECLEAMTVEDVRAFYRAHFTRDAAVVALGGGFSQALVERFRGSLELLPAGRPGPAEPPAPPPFAGRHALLVAKPGADASISFGFPIDAHRGEREFYALWLANSWLGEHRNSSSHLYRVIREARGMNYGDYSYIEAFPEGGRRNVPPTHVGRRQQLFEVWIRTLPSADAQFALRAAVREIEQLVDDGLSEEAFQLTRAFLKKYVLHFAETTADRLGYAVDDRFYGIDGEGHLARFQTVMDQLTRDEVNRALKKHLDYRNLKVAIVTGEAEKLRDALASEAPSPKTYPSEKPARILEEDREIAVFPVGIPADHIRVVPVDEMFQR
jgi:zinc protease